MNDATPAIFSLYLLENTVQFTFKTKAYQRLQSSFMFTEIHGRFLRFTKIVGIFLGYTI